MCHITHSEDYNSGLTKTNPGGGINYALVGQNNNMRLSDSTFYCGSENV